MVIVCVESKYITTEEDLNDWFKNDCGVMIDSRVYMTLDSILEVYNLWMGLIKISKVAFNDLVSQRNPVITSEFERIVKLAYKLKN